MESTLYKVEICPNCHCWDYKRIKRRWWMRLIPFSKFHYCSDCSLEFFSLFGYNIAILISKRSVKSPILKFLH